MDKKTLIRKAMCQLRREKEIMDMYCEKKNYHMLGFRMQVSLDKADFLMELGLIDFDQWRRLRRIISHWADI